MTQSLLVHDHPLCFFQAYDGDNVGSREQADFQRAESASGLAPALWSKVSSKGHSLCRTVKKVSGQCRVCLVDPDPVGYGTFWLRIRNNCTGSGSEENLYRINFANFSSKWSNSSLIFLVPITVIRVPFSYIILIFYNMLPTSPPPPQRKRALVELNTFVFCILLPSAITEWNWPSICQLGTVVIYPGYKFRHLAFTGTTWTSINCSKGGCSVPTT